MNANCESKMAIPYSPTTGHITHTNSNMHGFRAGLSAAQHCRSTGCGESVPAGMKIA